LDDGALVIAGQVPLCELVQEAKDIRAALAGEQADHRTKKRSEEECQDAERRQLAGSL